MPRYGYGYERRPRRKMGSAMMMRLLLAGGIALFALMSYWGMGQENPITGENQRVAMTEEQEIRMGLQAEPEMTRMHGGEHPDPEGQQVVDVVGQRLLETLNAWVRENGKENPYQSNFEFTLLRDPKTINAFALPGGKVFITAALFSQLQTEGQLAGVLGHEIGHVIERHGAQRMAKQRLTQGLAGAFGVAGGDINSARMAQMIGQMVNMKYGRQDELESDKWGVRLCVMAGYDPRSMLGVMDILDQASGGAGPPEMMSTHPKPANRKAYIEQVIRSEYPNGLPDGLVE